MIIDLQLTTERFLAGVRDELRRRSFCFMQTPTVNGETFVLDHVEVTNDTSLVRSPAKVWVYGHDGQRHQIDGSELLLTQEVRLHFVELAALQQNAAAPSPATVTPTVRLHFALTASSDDDGSWLHVAYRPTVDVGGLDVLVPGAASQIDAALANLSALVSLNIPALKALVGVALLFRNAGIVLDATGNRLTLRLESRTDPDNVTAWSDFFAGHVADLLGGREWGIVIERSLLVDFNEAMIDSLLSQQPDWNQNTLAAAWSANGHGVHVTATGVVHNVGPFDNDADVEFDVDVDFGVAAQDTVTTDVVVGEHVDVGGIGGAIVDFLDLDVAVGAGEPASSSGWVKTGERSWRRTQVVDLAHPLLGRLVIDTVIPDERGLHLAGAVIAPPPVKPTAVVATLKQFAWDVHGSCNTYWRISAVGSLGLVSIGDPPLVLCQAIVLADPAKQFPVTVVMANTPSAEFSAEVRVEVLALNPEYLKLKVPYECRVLVQTNGGARAVSFGTPGPLGDGEPQALESKRMRRVVDCYQLVNDFWLHGLKPWQIIPDPPDTLRLWQIRVRGLRDSEQAAVVDQDGRPVAVAHAGIDGVAEVSVVIPDKAAADSWRLVPWSTRDVTPAPTGEDLRSVDVRQVELARIGTLRLTQPAQGLRLTQLDGTPALAAVGTDFSDVYDLRYGPEFSWPDRVSAADPGFEAAAPSVTGVLVDKTFAHLEADGTVVALYRPVRPGEEAARLGVSNGR